MWFPGVFLVPLLAACAPLETVEDACRDHLPGEAGIDDPVALDALRRMDCYRHLAGMTRARADSRVQDSARAHVAYLAANMGGLVDLLTDWWSERPGSAGFTGESVTDRLAAVDYPIDGSDLFASQMIYLNTPGGAEGVDACFGDPSFRGFVLQPAWYHGGWSEGEAGGVHVAYGVATVPYNSAEGTAHPLHYPVDGQVDVPLSTLLCGLLDPRWGEMVGFPVSIIFGLGDQYGPFTNVDYVESPVLAGPHGPVDTEVRGAYEIYNVGNTLSVLPDEPLEPDSDYSFRTRVKWGEWEQDVDFDFHTQKE